MAEVELNSDALSKLDLLGVTDNLRAFTTRSQQVKTILLSSLQLLNAHEPAPEPKYYQELKVIFDALAALLNQVSTAVASDVGIGDALANQLMPTLDVLQTRAIKAADQVEQVTGHRPADSREKRTVSKSWGYLQWGLAAGATYLGVRYLAYPLLQDWLASRRQR